MLRFGMLALATAALVIATGGDSLWLALLVPILAVAAVARERAQLEREREELLAAALSDPLTGLENRRSLLGRAEYEIARHVRDGRSFAVVMLDLDGFKRLNDRFGHAAGDELLCDVADELTAALRAQDTVARIGGDEFCVLAPETDHSGTDALAARVRRAVSRVGAGADALGAGLGISVFPQDGHSVGRLMQVADQRLIAAKRGRRMSERRQAA